MISEIQDFSSYRILVCILLFTDCNGNLYTLAQCVPYWNTIHILNLKCLDLQRVQGWLHCWMFSCSITMTSQCARWRLKSPAWRLFTQPFIHAQIKENIKAPRHWPLCGNSPVTGEFPAQRTSNAENVSIWWRHHEVYVANTFPYWTNHYLAKLKRVKGIWVKVVVSLQTTL